ncbi:hypothetical protein SEA_YECEY3_49 [Mycobacterium phage Yecey3]|uniref:Uncharacterized protein n=1 Tax=Mycobacterium phage Yecey3 TaxID=2656617 RepID=A0A649V8X3_9CAUD|nr:hypothetical protein KIV58_gp060 [Mycobacterium phage Yecey3]QGJ88801.1 hypothetical protein SEA_YECEY3_49 [Mycobacterium phage Yecey3]
MRCTSINLIDGRYNVCAGEPMLDAADGVLIIQYEDGTSRTYNWEFVTDFYYMSEEETAQFIAQAGEPE